MPMFDFRCRSCGHEYSVLTSHDKTKDVTCPACDATDKERIYKVTVKGPIAGCGTTNSGFT